jgi:hypothetical protein
MKPFGAKGASLDGSRVRLLSRPDGHLLEYSAMLPDAPGAEQGIVPWREWEFTHRAAVTSQSSQTPP